jgi:hypothetical protein
VKIWEEERLPWEWCTVCEWCLDQGILQVSGSVLCSKDVILVFFLQVFIMGVNNKMPESKFK